MLLSPFPVAVLVSWCLLFFLPLILGLVSLADQQLAAASLSQDHSLAVSSLLPACLFSRCFCLSPPPARCLYSCPPPALSLYRLAAAAEQQRRVCLSAAAAAAAAAAASAPAAAIFLSRAFAVDTVPSLVRLALPFSSEAGALLGVPLSSSSSSSSNGQGPHGQQQAVSTGQDLLQQLSRLLTGNKITETLNPKP